MKESKVLQYLKSVANFGSTFITNIEIRKAIPNLSRIEVNNSIKRLIERGLITRTFFESTGEYLPVKLRLKRSNPNQKFRTIKKRRLTIKL